MKKILFTMMACLVLGLVTSCQDFSEPDESDTIPQALYLQDAEDVTSTSAFLRGEMDHYTSEGEIYFLVSETENFADSLKYYVEGRKELYYTAYCLKPATTYYYKLVGTDGYATVSSEVKSFTTLKGFELGKITFTDWDGTTKEVTDSMMPLGISLFTNGGKEDYWNMSVSKKDGKWQLPYDFSNTNEYGTPYYCSVYSPYNGDFKNEKYGYIPIFTYKNGSFYNKDMNCLTGSAQISNNSNTVDINLTHALARVRFHFTIASGSSSDVLYASNLTIQQDENQKIIPTSFWYSLGSSSVGSIDWFSSIDYSEKFDIWKNKTTDVTILSGPTQSSGTVTLKVTCSDGNVLTLPIELKADSWKSGGTYDYNITYDMNELYITDVKVTEWNNNQNGNIYIYD